MGLHIMNYRAGVIGASLQLHWRIHGGTRVTCALPLHAQNTASVVHSDRVAPQSAPAERAPQSESAGLDAQGAATLLTTKA